MRAIFLIKSPLQLLNAYEAKHHYGLASRDCLVVLSPDNKSRHQLVHLVRDSRDWDNVLTLSEAALFNCYSEESDGVCRIRKGSGLFESDFFAVIKLNAMLKRIKGVEKVFMGDIGNILMRHVANRLPNAEAISLDDGIATLSYTAIRYGAKEMASQKGTSKKVKLFLKRKLMGLQDQLLDKLTFFSVYDLDIKPPDHYVRHEYPWFRNNLADIQTEQRIYFIGSPLVEIGLWSESEFLEQLKLVKGRLGRKDVLYVAHRRENLTRVKALVKELGWEACLFDYPIEYQLAKVGPRPLMLASFGSSALVNCKVIFGESLPIYSFIPSPEHYSKKDTPMAKGFEGTWRHYKSIECDSFRVFDL